MKKAILVAVVISILLMALAPAVVFAGDRNSNGENGEHGTGIINGLNGCRPPIEAGDYWVYVPTELLPPIDVLHEWMGGPCCPSNEPSNTNNAYPLPNQCCNPPDYLPNIPPFNGAPSGEQRPGNHCLCFELRGYPLPALLPYLP
jgi:hypothetical protein